MFAAQKVLKAKILTSLYSCNETLSYNALSSCTEEMGTIICNLFKSFKRFFMPSIFILLLQTRIAAEVLKLHKYNFVWLSVGECDGSFSHVYGHLTINTRGCFHIFHFPGATL